MKRHKKRGEHKADFRLSGIRYDPDQLLVSPTPPLLLNI